MRVGKHHLTSRLGAKAFDCYANHSIGRFMLYSLLLSSSRKGSTGTGSGLGEEGSGGSGSRDGRRETGDGTLPGRLGLR